MNASIASDPYLDVPLDGVRLIEASAGTGKTYTLATLVTRLVIERGLTPPQILVVTFTDAATQELRKRLRERLELAARVAEASTPVEPSPEAICIQTIVQRHLLHGAETEPQLAARLRRAAQAMDLAAVSTIHGFCLRVLTEHALEAAQPFVALQLAGSDKPLRTQAAIDAWRVLGVEASVAQALPSVWSDASALADDLRMLLRADRLLPTPQVEAADPRPALQAAAQAVRLAWQQQGAHAQALLDAALNDKVLDGQKVKRPSFDKAWETLRLGLAHGDWSREAGGHLDKLRASRLRALTKAGHQARTPQSSLFEAMDAWFDASDACLQWQARRRIEVVHRARALSQERLQALKQAQQTRTYDDLIDALWQAVHGSRGEALIARLRAQYAVALVDEFQDTDSRQWAIFQRIFATHAPALLLIGDPKQAIYGFRGGDVQTYLRAAQVAERGPPLARNFRSRPAVLRAIAALYAHAGEAQAFNTPGIAFHPVEPGGHRADNAFVRDGRSAPGLTLCELPATAEKRHSADESRALVAQACAAEVHALLRDARQGRAHIDGRPLQAGDIAILVRSHKEAALIRDGLAQVGVAAVTAGKQSIFATVQARELLAVLEAALAPGDESRLRAALATLWLGMDAQAIARMDTDPAWRARQLQQATTWREHWRAAGPFALVAALAAEQAARLLGLVDGERRLSNLLQLGEELQAADARALGERGVADWLRMRIAQADPDDDTQQLRLESDARRVQIITLHKSKGLEFPLVFLPFAGIGRKAGDSAHVHVLSQNAQRVAYFRHDPQDPDWRDASQTAAHEARSEDARLLYVGLTRAQHALWLATGPLFNGDTTPLHAMLSDLTALRAQSGLQAGDIVLRAPLPLPAQRLSMLDEPVAAPARLAQSSFARDWWVHSFTQWAQTGENDSHRLATAQPASASDDEPTQIEAEAGQAPSADWRFSGSRFGNALHTALESVDFAAWRHWSEAVPESQNAALTNALRGQGYAQDELPAGRALLGQLVGGTLNARLPEGVRLCDVPVASRRAEMEFHFSLQPVRIDALLTLLHAHAVLRTRHGLGLRRHVQGLMTGKIDLTYTVDARWYLLDYKSNRLATYDPNALAQAMAHSQYDLQAVIYTLALHRWLRFRLRGKYDYTRDFGGVRYVFCRGAQADTDRGVYAFKPAPALIAQLDALFGGGGA